MKTKEIEFHLLNHISSRQDFNILTTNLNWILPFEADVFHINSKNEIIEYEIKSSRGDFLKDKKKKKITRFGTVGKYNFLFGIDVFKIKELQEKRPNRFYYVCPSGLINKNEVPKGFGLIWVMTNGQCSIEKRAVKLHVDKVDNSKLILEVARNFCIKQCRKNTKYEN